MDYFAYLLKQLHPAIAKRRLRELETNPKVLRAMPFNGDHVTALSDVLLSIASDDQVDIQSLINRLMLRSWPEKVYNVLTGVLEDAAPISDDELRSAFLRYLRSDHIESFTTDAPFTEWFRAGPHYYNELNSFFGGKRIDRTWDQLIDDLLEYMHLDINIDGFYNEALYYHVTSGTRMAFHDSDIRRLAERCNLDVAMQAVSHIKSIPKPTRQLRQVIACLEKRCSRKRGFPGDVTELYLKMRPLGLEELEAVFAAVDRACTRLCSLPRYIARNWMSAMAREGHDEFNEAAVRHAKLVLDRHFAPAGTAERATIGPLFKDLTIACCRFQNHEHRMAPVSLLGAPVDVLVDINDKMRAYFKSKGWDHESDWV